MPGPERSPARQLRLSAVSAIAILMAAMASAQGQIPEAAGPGDVVSGKDILLSPPAGHARFRFLPAGEWALFDRTLVLSAAEREERSYELEVDPGEGPSSVTHFLVDKRVPDPPTAVPATGLYRDSLSPRLGSAPGTRILWSLIGPSSAEAVFRIYDQGSRPTISLPATGTALYTLIAYAEDGAGNRSLPVRFLYRFAEQSLPASAPVQDKPLDSPVAAPELPIPEIVYDSGNAVIVAHPPSGRAFVVAVNPGSSSPRSEDFAEAIPEGQVSRFLLSCPYGWSGTLQALFGFRSPDGSILYNPKALALSLSSPPDPVPLLAQPPAPRLSPDPLGRGAFISFPSFSHDIVASVDDGPEKEYTQPIAVPPGKTRLRLSWYGLGSNGTRSERSTMAFDLPPPIPEVSLRGADEGSVLGSDVTIAASSSATVRYEMGLDGSVPDEPDSASPLLGSGLQVACPAGEVRKVILRYRAFSGPGTEAAGGEGRLLRFSIDKRPPGIPSLAGTQGTYSDRERSLSLVSDEGAGVYVSVSTGTETAPFRLASGPIELGGDQSGPIRYTIRAYAVSRSGIRSGEMQPLVLTVDLNSIYVYDKAAAGGDGSPDRPFSSLDAAFALAARTGKQHLKLLGRFELRTPFTTEKDLSIAGGFDSRWESESGMRATIMLPPAEGPAISVRNAALVLKGLSFAKLGGRGALASAEGARLSITDSELSISGDGDFVMLRAQGSSILVERSSLSSSRAMSFVAIDASATDIVLSEAVLSAKAGVRLFGAINQEGGSLRVSGSLLESSADLALTLLSLRGVSLLIDRTLIRAESGTGYLRIGRFSDSPGEIRSSKCIVSWKGAGTLFESHGSSPSFRFDTVIADTASGSLRFFDAEGGAPEIWNCILTKPSGGGELLRSTEAPLAGSLVADCLWGFDSLASGALSISSLASLNALNAPSARFAARPHVSEPPARTFGASVKSLYPLSPASACVGAALPLDDRYATDFAGRRRPGGTDRAMPDIGADQAAE